MEQFPWGPVFGELRLTTPQEYAHATGLVAPRGNDPWWEASDPASGPLQLALPKSRKRADLQGNCGPNAGETIPAPHESAACHREATNPLPGRQPTTSPILEKKTETYVDGNGPENAYISPY